MEKYPKNAMSVLTGPESAGEELASLLRTRLENKRALLRPNQITSIEKLISALQKGIFQGLIKQPTGAGKTRLFGEILHALRLPTLVLVPRTTLVDQTKQELTSVGYDKKEVVAINPKGKRSAAVQVNKALGDIFRQPNWHVVVMTYQSFLSVAKKKDVLSRLLAEVKVVISDEAHRSVGQRTAEVLSELDRTPGNVLDKTREEILTAIKKRKAERSVEKEDDEVNLLEELDPEERQELVEVYQDEGQEQAIEKLVKTHAGVIHLRLTATPRLAEKEVQEVYGLEVIDWVRIQQLVEDGTLILPTLAEVGTATYAIPEQEGERHISDSYLSSLTEADRFRMENGMTVSQANTDEYLRRKESCGGYLPGVVFCGTVRQAETYLRYLRSRGIRTVRVTSATEEYDAGTSAQEAKRMIENDQIDLVVTISKVGEGWDVPTLRCAIWNVPTYSPARSLQGNGRIMRSLPESSSLPNKNRENTFIIEPQWVIARQAIKDHGTPPEGTREKNEKKGRKVFLSSNFFERLLELDEIGVDSLRKMGIKIDMREKIDLKNDDHLRELIESPDRLIRNRRGINLQKEHFVHEQRKWNVGGRQICWARFGKKDPGCAEAEALARQLWPEEAEKLLGKK